MATVLGSLLVSLGLESAEFDRGLDKARRGMRRAGNDFNKESDRMYQAGMKVGTGIKAIGAAAAAAGFAVLANAMQNAVQGSLEFASSLGETAAQLGVTSDALQEYRYAATQAGLSQEEMDKALAKLTRTIGEAANGSKKQVEAFNSLGIAIKDANGNVLNAADAIPMVADALKGVENPAQRAAVLTNLFGKAGQKLEPLLAGGSAAVNELRQAAHKLGAVLSEDQIQRADDTADKLAALNTVLKARVAGVVADNADAILGLANAFVALVNSIGRAAAALQNFNLRRRAAEGDINAAVYSISPFASDREKAKGYKRNANQAREQMADNQLRAAGLTLAELFPKKSKPMGAGFAEGFGGGGGGGGSNGGGGGRSAADIAKEAARNAASFNAELGRLQVDQLQAEAEYTGNIQQAYAAKVAALDADLAAFRESTALDENLTATQRAALLAAKEGLVEQEKQNAEQELGRELAAKEFELTRSSLQIQIEDAQLRADMADNSRDRRDAELEILALQDRLRIAELDRIMAVEATASAAWQNAKLEKEAIQRTAGSRQDAVRRGTMSPGEAYMNSISRTPGQINDAIEQIKVDGLQAFNDGLVDAIVNFKSLGDVASSVIKQILADLIRLQIQQAIMGFIGQAVGLGVGGGGMPSIGQALSSVGSQLGGSYVPLPGFASGTNFAPGGLAIVGEKGPELVNLRRGSQVIPNHELGGMGGSQQVHKPTFVFPGISNAKEAREAATQAARRYRRELNPMRA